MKKKGCFFFALLVMVFAEHVRAQCFSLLKDVNTRNGCVMENASFRPVDENGSCFLFSKLQHQQQQLSAGSNALLLDVKALPAGTYYLELTGAGVKEREMFIKQ